MIRWPWQKRKQHGPRGLAVRGFAAAQVDRLLAGWKWDGGFSAQEITSSLAVIRSRSREMAKNNPHMKRFLQLVATNIVGDAFAFKSMPKDGAIGSQTIDAQAARFIEYHFWRWCNTPAFCDATGRKTVAEMDRLNCRTWARDGEYFILLDTNAQNPYGINLRVLRPDFCPEWYNTDTVSWLDQKTGETVRNDNIVRCGVEMDRITMRPVAYYMQTSPDHAWITTQRGALTRIPAARIIHGFTQEDEDQPRGIPWAHAALRKLKMLDEFDTAELTAARDEACSVRTYYAPKGDEDQLADLTSEENAEVANALTQEKEAGQAEVLPIGWKSEVNTPQHPNREVTAFKVTMLKDVATGFGVEYSAWANDWSGVSFSSVRAGTIAERDQWIVYQAQKIAQSKTPIFQAWLRSFLSLGISGNLPLAKFDKFAEHEFRGRRWMWVDPMKDMKAAELAVAYGWKTNTQIASDMGTDFGDNCDELRRELVISEGLDLGPINNNPPMVDDTEDGADESADDGADDMEDSAKTESAKPKKADDAGIADVVTLNGAQITAAVEVIMQLSSGQLSDVSAVELLVATGIDRNQAVKMVAAEKKMKKPKVVETANEAQKQTA